MSVMLTFGLALASLAYKQEVIATSGIESQYAFYAADAALECALYADQQQQLFAYANHSAPPSLVCNGVATQIGSSAYGPNCFNIGGQCANEWVTSTRIQLDAGCADVTVYKPATTGTTYIFSQGYDVSCSVLSSIAGSGSTARYVSRGLEAHY
jgi:Tfp pilus assembly protein PilX